MSKHSNLPKSVFNGSFFNLFAIGYDLDRAFGIDPLGQFQHEVAAAHTGLARASTLFRLTHMKPPSVILNYTCSLGVIIAANSLDDKADEPAWDVNGLLGLFTTK